MKRKITRTIYHLSKFFIRFIIHIDSRLYMKLFVSLLKANGLIIEGNPRFIAISVKFDDFDKITIGDRLVASMNVHFLTHDYSFTTALISIGEQPDTDIGTLRKIHVGSNVFIGMNSILLPGTSVGNNVIIGAGSIVRGKIPDYSIVVGNPARVIGDIREYANKVKLRKDHDLRIDKR